MTTPPMTDTQNVCASDPNFAVIFAFCEQFGDNCGVTIPTFQELQDMLEKTNEGKINAMITLFTVCSVKYNYTKTKVVKT